MLIGTVVLTALGTTAAFAQLVPGHVLRHGEVGRWTFSSGGLVPGPPFLKGDDTFGAAIAPLGDLDGDGTLEVAVGAPNEVILGGYSHESHVWFLSYASDGSVVAASELPQVAGPLAPANSFGMALAALGDVDGDGICDLAVSTRVDEATPQGNGAVWLLFLDTDASVKRSVRIGDAASGFVGPLHEDDGFGHALAGLGDLDGDGCPDLAVGAPGDHEAGPERGAVWILFLAADGSVQRQQKLSDIQGQLNVGLDDADGFGWALGTGRDLTGDGRAELLVGAPGDDDVVAGSGAVYVLVLQTDGKVQFRRKLTVEGAQIGRAACGLGDLDGDGQGDLALGAPFEDGGGIQRGAVWLVRLRPDLTIATTLHIEDGSHGFDGPLFDVERFGWAVESWGAVGATGYPDLFVGCPYRSGGFASIPWAGSTWLLRLNAGVVQNLGGALPGSTPGATLALHSTLEPGASAALTLDEAAAGGATWLVVGLSVVRHPFLGGTLVPAPDIAIFAGWTDTHGALEVTGPWPLGVPSHSAFVFQAWTEGLAGPFGWAASGALQATTP